MTVDPNLFRQVLGQYPTGVVVVTAAGTHGEPLGMTIGSFTSVSLDPPLIAFLPSKTSNSWAALQEAGERFAVNVLTANQEDLCRAISISKEDKFADIGWTSSPQGNPILDGVVAWLDCTTESRFDAGDHEIVLGRVLDLEVVHDGYPLLFFRGGYGSFLPLTMAASDTDLGETLELVDCARPLMEELEAEFGIELTAVAQIRDELVVVAAVGRTPRSGIPTRVGSRTEFCAPFGSIFAAHGTAGLRRQWLAGLESAASSGADHEARLDVIRERGYAMTLRHPYDAETTEMHYRGKVREPKGPAERAIRTEITSLVDAPTLDNQQLSTMDVRTVQAPVFAKDGSIAFALVCWTPSDSTAPDLLSRFQAAVVEAARSATERIALL